MRSNKIITFLACLVFVFIIIVYVRGRSSGIVVKKVSEISNASSLSPLLTSKLTKLDILTPSTTISALLADNDTTRQRGLGGVTSMGDHEGMLFAFPTPGMMGFWMKDTYIPLDMIWIDQDKTVVGMSENVLPDSYPKIYLPPSPVLYVLEINGGAAARLGINLGTKLQFAKPKE